MAEPEGGFADPEEVFGKMFGGDRFEDLIGQISIGQSSPSLCLSRPSLPATSHLIFALSYSSLPFLTHLPSPLPLLQRERSLEAGRIVDLSRGYPVEV